MSNEVLLPTAGPSLSSRDADLLGAWMIWPDDDEFRAATIHTYLGIRALEESATLSRDALIAALQIAVDAPSKALITQEAHKRAASGVFVGNVFRSIIANKQWGKDVSVGAELDRQVAMFKHDGNLDALTWPLQKWFPTRPLPTAKRSAESMWIQFKPVAHLWAAWIHLQANSPSDRFPCAAEQLGELVARSKQYLEAAETIRVEHSPKPFRAPDAVLITLQCDGLIPGLPPLKLDPKGI